MHERVDLHPLDLGRVLAGGEVVALERGLLRAVDGLGGLPQHRDDDEHHAAEDDRVHRVEDRHQRHGRAAGGVYFFAWVFVIVGFGVLFARRRDA